jgi:hypothetical protein
MSDPNPAPNGADAPSLSPTDRAPDDASPDASAQLGESSEVRIQRIEEFAKRLWRLVVSLEKRVRELEGAPAPVVHVPQPPEPAARKAPPMQFIGGFGSGVTHHPAPPKGQPPPPPASALVAGVIHHPKPPPR